ncbi:MAG: SDR family oxidoreductase [Acidimicrobiia bacterium]|nr:SDR family oxidoreductase [Acidimicrobiia bacterium]
MNLDLDGKRALVTGSTLGIGRGIAEALVAEGAEVIVNGRDADRVEITVSELSKFGSVTGFAADLSTLAGAAELADYARSRGHIDILVNNAGYFEVKEFWDLEEADWKRSFELNVMSGVRLAREFLRPMLDGNWGRVIFIASEQSSKPNPSMIHYAMSKTAQISIARGLAELTTGTNVTVNSVRVAPTWTNGVQAFMNQAAKTEDSTAEEMSLAYFEDGEGSSSLLERWATPAEIANVVTFLCSPRASAINGASTRVDGGMIRSLF